MTADDFPGFEAAPNDVLWRYMTAARYESLLSDGLYFASARQFSDAFEGAITDVESTRRSTEIDERFPEEPDMQRFLTDGTFSAFEDLRRLVKINCWHAAEDENIAMWERYLPAGERGVAVMSTVGALKSSLELFRLKPTYGSEPIFVGAVRYIDYSTDESVDGSERGRFLHKRIEYRDEHEIRAILSLRVPNNYGISVPENGVFVPIDLRTLITEIRLSPGSDQQDLEAIRRLNSDNEFEQDVCHSSLDRRPTY